MTSREWDDWSRRLQVGGSVDLTVGDRVIVRVQGDGVWLPSRDLLVRWQHLGFADGWEQPRFSGSSTLSTGWSRGSLAPLTRVMRRR